MSHSSGGSGGSGGKSSFSTTTNSFAVLSNLDSNKGSSSGPRNKGSYSKNSMERDRHGKQYYFPFLNLFLVNEVVFHCVAV